MAIIDNRIKIQEEINLNWWIDYSTNDNKNLLLDLLEYILNRIDATKGDPYIWLAKSRFKDSITVSDYLQEIEKNQKYFIFVNYYHDIALREQSDKQRRIKLYYFRNKRFSREDLNENFILDVDDPDLIYDQITALREEVMVYHQPDDIAPDYKNPKKSNWFADKNKRLGVYKFKNNEIILRGGRFGGINILIENSGREIDRDLLLEEIRKYTSGGSKDSITITKWKYGLNTERHFSKYFYLHFTKPNLYRLYLVLDGK